MATSDKRRHMRVQCFMLQRNREIVPIWAFASEVGEDAVPGLIMDCSDGGVQILTDRDVQLTLLTYQLEIHRDSQTTDSIIEWFEGPIRHIWSRSEDALYATHGFAFSTENHHNTSAQVSVAANLRLAEHHVLRCTLKRAT